MPATFLYRFVFPLLAGIFLLVFPASTDALEPGEFDAAPWSKLLERFVTPQGVDYAAWKAHGTKDLDAWLALAAKHDIHSTLAKEPKAAFLINVYNAWAVRQVLDHYPLASASEIPGFHDANALPVAGSERTLAILEADLMKLMKQTPGVVFALAPASEGMPRLRSTAYTADGLHREITENASAYFAAVGLGLDKESKTLRLPPQFETHRELFDALERGIAGYLSDFISLSDVVEIATGDPARETIAVSAALNDAAKAKNATQEKPADGQ